VAPAPANPDVLAARLAGSADGPVRGRQHPPASPPFFLEFAANRFIFRRGRLRGAAHWLIMWGCVLAAAITFPLV
jgi:hypothetical protein